MLLQFLAQLGTEEKNKERHIKGSEGEKQLSVKKEKRKKTENLGKIGTEKKVCRNKGYQADMKKRWEDCIRKTDRNSSTAAVQGGIHLKFPTKSNLN